MEEFVLPRFRSTGGPLLPPPSYQEAAKLSDLQKESHPEGQ